MSFKVNTSFKVDPNFAIYTCPKGHKSTRHVRPDGSFLDEKCWCERIENIKERKEE